MRHWPTRRRGRWERACLEFVLSREGTLCTKARANADVMHVVALKQAQARAFPAYATPGDWALLRAGDPAAAARVAKKLLADEADAIRMEIDRVLSPLSGSVVLEHYLMLLIAGKESEANEVLARAEKHGVPMPIEAK